MTTNRLPHVTIFQPYMGSDAEFFFTQLLKKRSKVVGAELVIPKEGLKHNPRDEKPMFVIDGVQAELHPRPHSCRESMGYEMAAAFRLLLQTLAKNPSVKADFSQSVKITKGELKKLDKEHQKLGCSPSLNTYESTAAKLLAVDPLVHTQRSAGGHIHIDMQGWSATREAIKDPEAVVKMLDIICGNTCVLIDRDKGNAIRRKLYGTAGEYRLPKHGIEYRTLSNFWLRHYQLMSFAFGMARLAIQLVSDPNYKKQFMEAFFSAVDIKDVRKAINTNNFKLALKNFRKIEPLLKQVCQTSGHHPLHQNNMLEFYHFIDMIDKHGIEYWFKDDPIKHWTDPRHQSGQGFSYWSQTVVRNDMSLKKILANDNDPDDDDYEYDHSFDQDDE